MRHLRSLLRLGSFPQLMWGNLASHCNYVVTLYIGRSTLVGHRPMKSLLSVCPSVYSSVRPLLSFLKIGSLVFSDIIHDDSWPWYLLTDRARFLKKILVTQMSGPDGTKSGPKIGFLPFSQVWFISFLWNYTQQ